MRSNTNQLPQLETRAQEGDQIASMQADTLRNAVELLEQRVYDLEMAKMVSLQTAPQIDFYNVEIRNLLEKLILPL